MLRPKFESVESITFKRPKVWSFQSRNLVLLSWRSNLPRKGVIHGAWETLGERGGGVSWLGCHGWGRWVTWAFMPTAVHTRRPARQRRRVRGGQGCALGEWVNVDVQWMRLSECTSSSKMHWGCCIFWLCKWCSGDGKKLSFAFLSLLIYLTFCIWMAFICMTMKIQNYLHFLC